MTKEEIVAKLTEYADRPVTLGLADQAVVLHSGIEGHWLFLDDENSALTEVKINTSSQGLYSATPNQQEEPFVITTVQMDTVNFIRSYIGGESGSVRTSLTGLAPISTTKSFDDVIKDIESSSVRKASSPTGNLNSPVVAPGGSYGSFKGSYLSTEKEGVPKYVKDKLLS